VILKKIKFSLGCQHFEINSNFSKPLGNFNIRNYEGRQQGYKRTCYHCDVFSCKFPFTLLKSKKKERVKDEVLYCSGNFSFYDP